jgi:hypothetical protein
MRRVCPTCPYKWVIAQRISMRTHLKRKEVDDVLGGKDSWANVDVVDGESIHSVDGHLLFMLHHERVDERRKEKKEERREE